MIPAFPDFKIVSMSDKGAVEGHTHRFAPYSDFNFTSLWAWDASGERMISELNGNLVVRFTDYDTREPFLSFLGTHATEDTARMLIAFCQTSGLPTTLRLMPELSVKDMRPSVLTVEEDRANHDYIYTAHDLGGFHGRRYHSKKNNLNRFRSDHDDARLRMINLGDQAEQLQILEALKLWAATKKPADNSEHELSHERSAIERLCLTANSHELVATVLLSRATMLAFSIDEILPDNYSICHFAKSDSRFRGALEFLTHAKAGNFTARGGVFINLEQDLGIENLRRSKLSFRPHSFLKKYRVALA
jgi:uncharacterized protein